MDKPEYDRLTVWRQTVEHYNDFPEQDSTLYARRVDITLNEMDSLPRPYTTTLVPVIERDCVDVAVACKRGGYKPILLNMCSWTTPGGGVTFGCPAQEEELFRRGNYHKYLHAEYYPFSALNTIVSRGVEFCRRGLADGYVKMEQPVRINCIAAPAPYNPRVTADGQDFAQEDDREFMRQKVRMLLYTAAKEGSDCPVLSAWGCGAYGCPPRGVARIFKEVLGEFAGVFRQTPFAILGYNNFAPFLDVLGGDLSV